MFAWSEVCGERPAVMGIVNVTPDSFSDQANIRAGYRGRVRGVAVRYGSFVAYRRFPG